MTSAPHNIEAEQELLGALLLNNDTLDRITGILEPHHFFEPLHGRIFAEIQKRVMAGGLATATTIRNLFQDDEAVQEVGGVSYLAQLISAATTGATVVKYAETVRELSVRRDMMRLGLQLSGQAQDFNVSAVDVLMEAERDLSALSDSGTKDASVNIGEAAQEVLYNLQHGIGADVVPTGITDIDKMILGPEVGTVTILGARPSMGKSAVGLQMGMNVALRGEGVLFHALEMTNAQTTQRALSSLTRGYDGVPYQDMRGGELSQMQSDKIVEASKALSALPLIINDRSGLGVSQITLSIRKAKRELAKNGQKLRLVVVDHIGLMKDESEYSQRHLQLGQITKALLAMAKREQVAVLGLYQLSRANEAREDKRPTLSDLRQSGEIEEDAACVMLLHRQHYYRSKEEPPQAPAERADWEASLKECENVGDLIVSKNRNGPTGIAKIYVDLPCNYIGDLTL